MGRLVYRSEKAACGLHVARVRGRGAGDASLRTSGVLIEESRDGRHFSLTQ